MKSHLAPGPLPLDPHPGTRPSLRKPELAGVRPSALAAFLLGSFVAHGVAYAALSSLPQTADVLAPDFELEFTVLDTPPEPEAVTLPEAPPAPAKAVVPPAPRRRVEAKPVVAAVPEAPQAQMPASDPGPAPLSLGSSTDTGLSVAGSVGASASHGNGTGMGTTSGTGAGPAVRKIDLRPIATDWVRKVNLAISTRALRDYPRSALRAHLEGNVLLAVQVDIHGRLSAVEIKQSSGHVQLDEAALAAARALVELPAPPEALHGQLRPIRIPINYRVQ